MQTLTRNEIESKYRRLERFVASEDAVTRSKSAFISSKEAEVQLKHKTLRVMEESRKFLENLAKEREEEFRNKIQSVVQFGLDAIFGIGKYAFVVRLETLANRRVVKFGFQEVLDKPESFADIVDCHGGAVVEAVVFLLQVSLILFSGLRPFIVADEKFSFLDSVNTESMMSVMNQLSEKLGVQVLLVTHDDQLAESTDSQIRLVPSDNGVVSKQVIAR